MDVAGECCILIGEVEVDALEERLEARHGAQLSRKQFLEWGLLRGRKLQRLAREERCARQCVQQAIHLLVALEAVGRVLAIRLRERLLKTRRWKWRGRRTRSTSRRRYAGFVDWAGQRRKRFCQRRGVHTRRVSRIDRWKQVVRRETLPLHNKYKNKDPKFCYIQDVPVYEIYHQHQLTLVHTTYL